jgi:hypothetical protein
MCMCMCVGEGGGGCRSVYVGVQRCIVEVEVRENKKTKIKKHHYWFFLPTSLQSIGEKNRTQNKKKHKETQKPTHLCGFLHKNPSNFVGFYTYLHLLGP